MAEEKVAKAGIWYTVGNYFIGGLSFLTIPIFARIMTVDDYGIYNEYMAYQGILYLLVGCGLGTSLKNAKIRYEKNFDGYVKGCVTLTLLSTLVWFVILNALYYLGASYVHLSRGIVNVLLLHSLFMAMLTLFNNYVAIFYRYKDYLIMSIFNAVGNIALSIFLIVFVLPQDGVTGRIIGTVVPLGFICVYILWYFYKKKTPRFQMEQAGFALKFSLPTVPHSISQVVLAQFDRVMISSLIGNKESGIYSFAYNIFSIIQITAGSLDGVWGPWLFEKMQQKEYDTIKKQSTKYAFGMLLFCLGMLSVSPEMIYVMGSEKYAESIYSVIPIIVGGYFMFLFMIPVQVEYYYAKTNLIAMATILSALCNVVLNYIFIQSHGYIAAAYTTLFTYFLLFVLHFTIAKKLAKVPLFSSKFFFGFGVVILCGGALTLVSLEYVVLRWVVGGIIGAYLLYWLNKEVDLKKVWKR